MFNKIVNVILTYGALALIVAGSFNFLTAFPLTSSLINRISLNIENFIVASKTEMTAREEQGEERTSEEPLWTGNNIYENYVSELTQTVPHEHQWIFTAEYEWVTNGDGTGHMEIFEVKWCECGAAELGK